MNKKKIKSVKSISLILVIICIASIFGGCSNNAEDSAMYINVAQLNDDEQNIASLLGAGNDHLIFDFSVDETIKSVQINTYRLINGKWELESGGGGRTFEDKHGRLALGFDKIPEGLRIAFQSENHGGADKFEADLQGIELPTGCATTSLQSETLIEYEKEIPLVIQVLTSQNAIKSYSVDCFETPEKYETENYEYVYAITIRFSQKTVNELG